MISILSDVVLLISILCIDYEGCPQVNSYFLGFCMTVNDMQNYAWYWNIYDENVILLSL